MIGSIELIETKVAVEKLPKAPIDEDGLRRFWVKINWKDPKDDRIRQFIRDFLKIRYSPSVKYLKPVSFSYVAQKSNVNNDSNDITSAGITIEPLNNDFEKYISLIPISQKLKLGTEFTFNKSIGYDVDSEGIMPNRLFISSSNLECKDKEAKHPILQHVHIGAMEIGSQLKMKFVVEKASHVQDGSTFSMINFRRHPDDAYLIISHYNYWRYTTKELFEHFLDFVKNEYKSPVMREIDANDYGANILYKETLISCLEEIIEKLPSEPTEIGTIEILEKYIV